MLRSLGRRLGEPGTLPSVDAVLRQNMQIKKGTKISELWDGEPFEGNVVEISKAESTLYPGQERTVFKVHYPADNTKEDLEDEEIRKLLVIDHLEVRAGCRTTRAREHAQLSGARLRACSHTHTRAYTHTHARTHTHVACGLRAPSPYDLRAPLRPSASRASPGAQVGDRLAQAWL